MNYASRTKLWGQKHRRFADKIQDPRVWRLQFLNLIPRKAKLLLLKFLLHRVNYITLQCVRNEASQESITQLKVDSNEAI